MASPQEIKDSLSEFLVFHDSEANKPNSSNEVAGNGNELFENKEVDHQTPEEDKIQQNITPKIHNKRKRKYTQNDHSQHLLTEIFLRITYPLSTCDSKYISVGLNKLEDYEPVVILSHDKKQITLRETAWKSLNKYMHLIVCYLDNKVYGKKTVLTLADSNIAVDNVKARVDQCVRFRNLSKYEEKVLISADEFQMLTGVSPAINRYLKQLEFAAPMAKDYLKNHLEEMKDVPIIFSPVDISIFNRLPHEVYLYRFIMSKKQKTDENCAQINLPQEELLTRAFHPKDEIEYEYNKNEAGDSMK